MKTISIPLKLFVGTYVTHHAKFIKPCRLCNKIDKSH